MSAAAEAATQAEAVDTAAQAAAQCAAQAAAQAAEAATTEETAAGVQDPRTVITVEHEYGRDPRGAPPWISENTELLNDLATRSKAQPSRAAASLSGAIGSICTLADFEAALERGEMAQRPVVVKFYSAQCRSCRAAKPMYEKVADGFAAAADFYEVDTAVARVLCALANIQKTPVVHTYSHGELQGTRSINNRELFEEFADGLSLLVQGYTA